MTNTKTNEDILLLAFDKYAKELISRKIMMTQLMAYRKGVKDGQSIFNKRGESNEPIL